MAQSKGEKPHVLVVAVWVVEQKADGRPVIWFAVSPWLTKRRAELDAAERSALGGTYRVRKYIREGK